MGNKYLITVTSNKHSISPFLNFENLLSNDVLQERQSKIDITVDNMTNRFDTSSSH